MELFTFLQMSGSLERVTALAMPGKEVRDELSTFDAAAAQCYKAEDRERLLGIVESAYGTYGAFNDEVRRIIAGATGAQMASSSHQAQGPCRAQLTQSFCAAHVSTCRS